MFFQFGGHGSVQFKFLLEQPSMGLGPWDTASLSLAIVRTISAFPDQHQSRELFPVSSLSLPKSETRTEEEKKRAKFLGYVKSNLVHTLAHMHTWARGGSWPLRCCHPPGKSKSNQDIRAVYALATSWAGAAAPFCRWQKNPGEGCVTPAVP